VEGNQLGAYWLLSKSLRTRAHNVFHKAIVRPPSENFAEGLTSLNLGAPDYARALTQHKTYCAALERCGLTLIRLEADARYPDSTFVEDTAVITESGAVLTNPGAVSRAGEVESVGRALAQFYSKLHYICRPGTLDGGDVCEAGNHFFIGISQRTNEAGATQLAALLASFGHTSCCIDIRGLKGILHLKSGLAYLGDKSLVVIEALASREEFRDYRLVRVSAGEEYAANCVWVNSYVLVAAGYPAVERKLQGLGYHTLTLDMSEFQKMDGGLSCLSLRLPGRLDQALPSTN
jgi:dimethylargininase